MKINSKNNLNGKCSFCSKKIDSKYTSCFLCNKQKQKRPVIPTCADCGTNKETIYKYCIDCYPKHSNDWKKKSKLD